MRYARVNATVISVYEIFWWNSVVFIFLFILIGGEGYGIRFCGYCQLIGFGFGFGFGFGCDIFTPFIWIPMHQEQELQNRVQTVYFCHRNCHSQFMSQFVFYHHSPLFHHHQQDCVAAAKFSHHLLLTCSSFFNFLLFFSK